MSTMLERMIQRTRGPLSSLEPVATPAFVAVPPGEPRQAGAPSAPGSLAGVPGASAGAMAGLGGAPGVPTDPGGPLGEVIAEEVSEAAPHQELDVDQPPGRRPARHVEVPADGRPAQRARARRGRSRPRPGSPGYGREPADFSPEPVPRGPAGPVPATPDPVTSAPVTAGPDRAPGPGRWSGSRGRPAAASPHPDEDHREPGSDPIASPGNQPHDARQHGIGTMRAVPDAGFAAVPARPGQAAAGERGAAWLAAASPAAAAAENDPAPVRLQPAQASAQSSATPGQWPSPTASAARRRQAAEAVPGPGPEITISIGHIEVRSAPVAERPRTRPPFRPQVSLADFLNQDRRP